MTKEKIHIRASKKVAFRVAKAWKDLLLDTWDTVDDERWMDLWYMHDPSEELKDVYLKYEWGDL